MLEIPVRCLNEPAAPHYLQRKIIPTYDGPLALDIVLPPLAIGATARHSKEDETILITKIMSDDGKKRNPAKADEGSSPASKRHKVSSPPPPYGSTEYWEHRYQSQLKRIKDYQVADTLPYHEWYFTYQDLRPILLPLILGGRQEAWKIIADEGASCADSDARSENHIGHEESASEGSDLSSGSKNLNDGTVAAVDEDDDVDEGGDGQSDKDEEIDREGLAKGGPITVLEIGCGDVPLGAELARELEELQATTGAPASSIASRIICTDCSSTVIEMMKRNYLLEESDSNSLSDARKKPQKLALEFEAVDCRKLPYEESSFDLILEKGTLDAVLSDTDKGMANCIQIVSECARTLKVGGYMVVVSHLNAHTSKGLDWLQQVVFEGLSKESTSHISWDIEVHGNEEVLEDDDHPSVPHGTAGPAVYVVHKNGPSPDQASDRSTPTIAVKFFAY